MQHIDPYQLGFSLLLLTLAVSTMVFYLVLKLPNNSKHFMIRRHMRIVYALFLVYAVFCAFMHVLSDAVFIVASVVTMLAVCYSIYNIFATRHRDITPYYRAPVFYVNVLGLSAVLGWLAYSTENSFAITRLALNINCSLVLMFACFSLTPKGMSATMGEKVAVAVFYGISVFIILVPIVFALMPNMAWTQSLVFLVIGGLIHVSHGSICTLILADSIREYYIHSVTDPLTQINNRRHFMTKGEQQISQNPTMSFAVLLCDLDWFKSINDTFGHAVGDKAIELIAQVLTQQIQEPNLVARLGGEEFAVLLPGANVDQAFECANRLKEQIKQIKFVEQQGDVQLTASFGVSDNMEVSQLSSLLKRADQALYEAKKNGRDRVMRYEPGPFSNQQNFYRALNSLKTQNP